MGDIIGSYYEDHPVKQQDFKLFNRWSRFTDDSVLNVAIAALLVNDQKKEAGWQYKRKRALAYAAYIKQYARRYPSAGYGQLFEEWVKSDGYIKQKSYGNGGAMRVIPIGYAYEKLEDVLLEAGLSCQYTHRHQEAIRGAKAVAAAVYLARQGESKAAIKAFLMKKLHYPLDFKLDDIRSSYVFNSRAGYCVPPAIVSFLESADYEDAIRKAISIGGDSDTTACMTGGIAEAYYQDIPTEIMSEGRRRLDPGLIEIVESFYEKYIKGERRLSDQAPDRNDAGKIEMKKAE